MSGNITFQEIVMVVALIGTILGAFWAYTRYILSLIQRSNTQSSEELKDVLRSTAQNDESLERRISELANNAVRREDFSTTTTRLEASIRDLKGDLKETTKQMMQGQDALKTLILTRMGYSNQKFPNQNERDY